MAADAHSGILLLDKPRGMSSHDAVAVVRRLARQRTVGHTGTLDPLADGLLVLCLGRATKVSQYLTGLPKTYDATVRLGMRSPTFDGEGIDANTPCYDVPELTPEDLTRTLQLFVGDIEQRVPKYSAVSVDGRRLYEAARRGEEVEAPVRTVTVSEIIFREYVDKQLRFSVACSKGTYIRSLADDIGNRIGCGGYLAALTRTTIGTMKLADAHSISVLETLAAKGDLTDALLPIEQVLPLGAMLVNDEMADRVVHGPPIGWQDIVQFEGKFRSGEPILLKNCRGRILAIGKAGVGSDATKGEDQVAPLFCYARVLA